MAGLLAARVLSDHYQEVTLLERDLFPRGPAQRRGVPQGRHTHGLLASGHEVLAKFFPGISESLTKHGALIGDIVRDCRWFSEGEYLSRPVSGLSGLLLTRPMLEAAVRERVFALPNIRWRDNVAVDALAIDASNGRVTGARFGNETINGDLVCGRYRPWIPNAAVAAETGIPDASGRRGPCGARLLNSLLPAFLGRPGRRFDSRHTANRRREEGWRHGCPRG